MVMSTEQKTAVPFSIYRKSNCIGIQLFVNKIKNKLDSFCINGGKFLNAGDVDVNSSDRK